MCIIPHIFANPFYLSPVSVSWSSESIYYTFLLLPGTLFLCVHAPFFVGGYFTLRVLFFLSSSRSASSCPSSRTASSFFPFHDTHPCICRRREILIFVSNPIAKSSRSRVALDASSPEYYSLVLGYSLEPFRRHVKPCRSTHLCSHTLLLPSLLPLPVVTSCSYPSSSLAPLVH